MLKKQDNNKRIETIEVGSDIAKAMEYHIDSIEERCLTDEEGFEYEAISGIIQSGKDIKYDDLVEYMIGDDGEVDEAEVKQTLMDMFYDRTEPFEIKYVL